MRSAARTGVANLPLHGGKAPHWLFQRMVKLARGITLAIVEDYGPEEMLRRMSDPHWFQAFGCVLGFDWHSSGVTTTVCGAAKEGLHGLERETGLYVAGGKGRVSRKTPQEIEGFADASGVDAAALVYASRMSAKVDSNCVQDGYQLYHHAFFFTSKGAWAVVQQGMNDAAGYARRYHWLGAAVKDYVCEPHAAICSQQRGETLNLVAQDSAAARTTIATLAAREPPERLVEDLRRIKTLTLPARHHVELSDIHPDRLSTILVSVADRAPQGFEELVALEGVGGKTLRALSLISEIIHGVPASTADPARFSFAHGGKDGHPYPVDRETYDRSIALLEQALRRARVEPQEKGKAIDRLSQLEYQPDQAAGMDALPAEL